MKLFLSIMLLSTTFLVAANNTLKIKKEFIHDNTQPSLLGVDYAFFVQGQNWVKGLNGMKDFSKCKLSEINEIKQEDGRYKANLTVECMY
ncbi:hypothetical protein [Sulfurospirillum arcachonense]|uniref:hypothetical protein n=1 Tax=Sulfurospirillum arcachonense TaxID=57666 RepID=UPI00046A6489|nr:hypothetical protein [Sulfurospirillum arcachonense]